MTAYRVFLDRRVMESLRSLKRKEQTALLKKFDQLANDPFKSGDYSEQDEVGRPIQVIVMGQHALYYWTDHAVKEVKILDLRAAGR